MPIPVAIGQENEGHEYIAAIRIVVSAWYTTPERGQRQIDDCGITAINTSLWSRLPRKRIGVKGWNNLEFHNY